MATSRGACLPGHRLSMAWTTAVLEDICALDDIKHKKTSITNSIRNTTKKLLEMKDRTCLERLSTSIQKKYLVLVERVERYKLTATKRHKLWVYFPNSGRRSTKLVTMSCSSHVRGQMKF